MTKRPIPASGAEAGCSMVSRPISRERLDAAARALSVVSLIALMFAVFKLFRGADSPFLAFSVIGGTVVHFTNRLRYAEMPLTVFLACVLALGYGGVISGVVGALSFLGLGSLLVLGWKASRSTQALSEFLLAAFCPLLIIVTNFALAVTSQFQPHVFDLFLYRLDGVFGFQPSFLMGKCFASFLPLQNVCSLVYNALPLAEVLVFVAFIRGKRRMPFNPMVAFCVAGVIGFLLYQVCPAVGPKQLFGAGFPQHPPAFLPLKVISVDSGFVRNAMPSLHTAWVLLIWWSVRYYHRWIRYAATVFVLLTLLATLGLGEHYAIDLIVAVPFAVLVIWCCAFSRSTSHASRMTEDRLRTPPYLLPSPSSASAQTLSISDR